MPSRRLRRLDAPLFQLSLFNSIVCTLGSLVEVLKPCSIKWYQIGLCLGLSVEELDTIKASVDHLQETLKLKLKRGEELTWGDVVIALYNVGEDELARQVARTHGQGW